MRTSPTPARSQKHLRQQINAAQARQDARIAMVARKKEALDECVASYQLELDNLKAQLTIGVA